jgi:uncharacterized protein involved in type VI secretion and phage assembly
MQQGVVVAVVESRDDPQQEGRIRVRYPWLPDEPRSAWAPIASPLAGKQRGAWFMPELEDEVLVAFEHGDFDHPFVVGYLWNGVDTPPDTDPTHRVIVTPGGHELRFEDTDDGKQVVLKTSGGHELVMTDRSGAAKVTVTSTAGHSVAIDDAAGSITLATAGGQRVSLTDAPAAITLSGGGRSLALANNRVAIT